MASMMASPRASRRDRGVPQLLLPKGITTLPLTRPVTTQKANSQYQKYSDHLPDRYLSQMVPFSSPLYDARVHTSRAKAHFKRKLHALRLIFVRVDKNQNGLIPRKEVRRCLAGSGILLPRAEVEAMLDTAAARDGEIYWRAITLRLSKIECRSLSTKAGSGPFLAARGRATLSRPPTHSPSFR